MAGFEVKLNPVNGLNLNNRVARTARNGNSRLLGTRLNPSPAMPAQVLRAWQSSILKGGQINADFRDLEILSLFNNQMRSDPWAGDYLPSPTIGFLPIFEDSTISTLFGKVLKGSNETIRRDELTGLYGKRAFKEDLALTLKLLQVGEKVSIIYLDLDSFGAKAKDETIKKIAKILAENSLAEYQPYRLGGDEFCWVIPLAASAEAALVAETIRRAVDAVIDDVKVSGSFGVVKYQKTAELPASKILKMVDKLIDEGSSMVKEAKERGKNCVCYAKDGQVVTVPKDEIIPSVIKSAIAERPTSKLEETLQLRNIITDLPLKIRKAIVKSPVYHALRLFEPRYQNRRFLTNLLARTVKVFKAKAGELQIKERKISSFSSSPGLKHKLTIPIQVNDKEIGQIIVSRAREFTTEEKRLAEVWTETVSTAFWRRDQAGRHGVTRLLTVERMREELKGIFKANAKEKLSVILVDIVGFKQFNDHGHIVGDKVLDFIARYLRTEDLVSHYYGGKFLSVLLGVNPEVAVEVSKRLNQQFGEEQDKFETELNLKKKLALNFVSVSYQGEEGLIPEQNARRLMEKVEAVSQAIRKDKPEGVIAVFAEGNLSCVH